MSEHPGSSRRDFLRQAAVLAAFPALPLPRWPPPSPRAPRADPPFVDGLSFLTERIEDLRDAGLSVVIVDVSTGEQKASKDGGAPMFVRTFEACARSLTAMRRRLRERPDRVVLATSASEVAEAAKGDRTAVVLQMQGGGEAVDQDLTRLDLFYELGLRIFQMTHHFDNPLAGGALEREPHGLTKLGFDAVARLDELGLIPDLSHASDQTALDVAKASKRPIIISHGGARALCHNPRCAPDEVIRAVADSGGVMGLFMMTFWLTDDPAPPTIATLVRQIRHVIDVGGLDAVGIANDYPVTGEQHLAQLKNDNAEGVKAYHPWWQSIQARGIWGFDKLPTHVVIPELNDVRRFFTMRAALEQEKFTAAEIDKILGGNWLRVLNA